MLKNFDELVNKLTDIVGGGLATLLMSIAFVMFLVAVVTFILKRRDGSAGLEQAKNMLLWSVFGLFVMTAVWGLVTFIGTNILGADNAGKTTISKPQTTFK